MVDEFEGVSLTETIGDGQVCRSVESKVEGSINLLVLATKVKAVEANISKHWDMMALTVVVLGAHSTIGKGSVDCSVISGVFGRGATATASTGLSDGQESSQEDS